MILFQLLPFENLDISKKNLETRSADRSRLRGEILKIKKDYSGVIAPFSENLIATTGLHYSNSSGVFYNRHSGNVLCFFGLVTQYTLSKI